MPLRSVECMTRLILNDDDVASLFSEEDADDGRALCARLPVRVLRVENGRDLSVAQAAVGALQVSIELYADGSIVPWCSHCGSVACAHVAAAMFSLLEREEPFGVGGVPRQAELTPAPRAGREGPAAQSWHQALDGVLDRQREDDSSAREVGLLLAVHTSRRGGDDGPAVVARPVVRGASGSWVRGDVAWRDVADADPRWRALGELAALYAGRENYAAAVARMHTGSGWLAQRQPWGSPEWMRLDAVPSRGLWEVLRGARDSGVALVADVPGQPEIALSADAARAEIDIRRHRGGLLVAAVLRPVGVSGDDARAVLLPIGAPTIAVARAGGSPLHIHELLPTVEALGAEFDALLARGELVVPADEVDAFAADYLPRLRDIGTLISSDASFEIPAPVPPTLVLAVRHSGEAARLFWEWEYAPAERRQPQAERALLDAVEAAADRFASLLRRGSPDELFPACDLAPDETVEFFAQVLPALRGVEGLRIEAHDEIPRYSFADEEPQIEFGVDPSGHDWLELNIVVTVQGEPVASGELLKALARGQTYFRLLSGTVFPLTDARFAKLRDVLIEARALKDQPSGAYRVPRLDIDLWSELAELGVISTQETQWLEAVRALGDERIEPRPAPEGLRAELRDYQREGFAWLDFLRRHRLGGVLADDMGLGKTVQILAALEAARLDEPDARFLVVAPTSVVGHWVREAARFVPDLRATALTATVRKRGTSVADASAGAALVVTSYAVFRLDHEEFAALGVRVLVLDEAQNVKNSSSKSYACARALEAPTKIAVTGTPLENNVMELFALTTLVAPGLLGTREHFRAHFHRAIASGRGSRRLAELRARIRPFLLRRTKEKVAPELPPKSEQVLEIELSSAHRRAYDRRFRREQQKLLGLLDDVEKHRIQILASLTSLRRAALDPSLGDGDPDAPSAKLDALGELLDEIVADGHRVLVFSQFTDFLGLAARVADDRGIRYAYLDGSTTQRGRQRMIDRFSSGEVPAFFISLKAGGTGLNLTAADYCVLLDPWWNPAAEAQAIDRAHRIGQERPVMVYRLIAAGTIEQKVRELQEQKRRLFDEVLAGASASPEALSAADYRALLS